MYRAARLIFSVSLPVIILLSSLQVIVFQPAYFDIQFSRYNIEEATGIESDDLRYIMGEVMLYLKGGRADLEIFAPVQGEEQEIFGEREKEHMVDVYNLFSKGLLIRNAALALVALAFFLMLLNSNNFYLSLLKALSWGAWFPLVLMAVASTVVATNFSYWFVVFHEVLFANDLWILDPSREILIQMLPEGFFMGTAFLTAAISVGTMLIIGLFSLVSLRRRRFRPLLQGRFAGRYYNDL